jgi:bacteriocin-like protein
MTAKEKTTKDKVRDERLSSAKALSDEELAAVSGGGTALSSAVSNVIKSVGEGLSQAARKG